MFTKFALALCSGAVYVCMGAAVLAAFVLILAAFAIVLGLSTVPVILWAESDNPYWLLAYVPIIIAFSYFLGKEMK